MTSNGTSRMPVMRGSPFCGAKLINGEPGNTCRNPAGARTNHPRYGYCYRHGGNTPTQIRAAQTQMIQDAAVIYGVPRTVDPLIGLMEEYYRTLGIVEALEAMVANLSPSEIWWGIQSVEETTGIDPDEPTSATDQTPKPTTERKTRTGASLNLQVATFERERDRAVRIAEIILKNDLEGRRVEVSQLQLAALAAVLLSPDLALTDDQRRVVARKLREMDQRAAIEGTAA